LFLETKSPVSGDKVAVSGNKSPETETKSPETETKSPVSGDKVVVSGNKSPEKKQNRLKRKQNRLFPETKSPFLATSRPKQKQNRLFWKQVWTGLKNPTFTQTNVHTDCNVKADTQDNSDCYQSGKMQNEKVLTHRTLFTINGRNNIVTRWHRIF